MVEGAGAVIEDIRDKMEAAMEGAVETMRRKLAKVWTGRAAKHVLDGVVVDFHGSPTPIGRVGQISAPESRLLQIRPFDKTTIAAIERAVVAANLGITPSNDGNLIRMPFPSLTEEKRAAGAREAKKIGEEARVAIRNERRAANDAIKRLERDKAISKEDMKRRQKDIQEATDRLIARVDDVVASKERELLEV